MWLKQRAPHRTECLWGFFGSGVSVAKWVRLVTPAGFSQQIAPPLTCPIVCETKEMHFLQLSSCKALRGHCGPSCFLRSWVVIHGDYAWQRRGICQPGRYVLVLILRAASMFCLPASHYCAHAVSFPRRAPEAPSLDDQHVFWRSPACV